MDDVDVSAAAGAEAASFPWGACFLNLTGGTIAGAAVGYALKSALKIALLIVGAAIVFLATLANAGFITVNWDAICLGLEEGAKAAGEFAYATVTQLSSSIVGFAAGAFAGWKLNK